MNKLLVQIANIPIGIDGSIQDYLEKKCSDYVVNNVIPYFDAKPNLNIINELLKEGNSYSDAVFHSLFNSISDKLPTYNLIVMHGACIKKGCRSVLLTGNRGVGKSFLSQRIVESEKNTSIINGDKTIVSVNKDGIYAHGSPWCGKEGINCNDSSPLYRVVVINKGPFSFNQLSQDDAFDLLINQTHLPMEHDALSCTFSLLENVIKLTSTFTCYFNNESVISAIDAIKRILA